MATSTCSRSADQAARAGRSASELARTGARLARARDGSESVERCQIPMIVQCRSRRSAARARASAILCKCCRFSDLLSMTPYLALARSAPAPSPPPRPGEADVSSDRLSSIVGPEPKSASQQFAKTKMTTSPAAAAPTRRLEQVAPPQSSRESARLARAREGNEHE